MTQVATINPMNQFFDQPSGLPLTNGKIYIGEENKDPEQFPITVYWDEAGLVPAIQPIRTTSGYPTRNGSPAILYVSSLYSMRVCNQGDVQVFYIQSAGTPPPVTPTPFIDTGLVPSFASGTTFTVTGDQTSVFLPGGLANLRVRMTLGSGFVYGTVTNAVFGALTTVTLTMDSTPLDASLSAVATSFLQPSPNAIPEGAFGAVLRATTTQAAARTALGVTAPKIINVVEATPYTTYTSAASAGIYDDTIPQIGEGTALMSVSITPTSTTSRLRVEFLGFFGVSAGPNMVVAAMFRDSTANAVTGGAVNVGLNTQMQPLPLAYEVAAGSTAATTFSIRFAGTGGASAYVNGSGTSRILGGVMAATLRVTEIAA